MPDKQEEFPNLNRGGNDGNANGAGRHRNAFRRRAARAAEEGLEYWIDVSRGLKVIRIPDAPKGRDKRHPTHGERKDAYVEILLRFGIGTQDEVVVLGNADTYRAVASAMKVEGHAEEAIVAVLLRLRETFREDAG